MPFEIGDNIGSYQITEQLGRGGMATVFKAYHASLDRYVAIKGMHKVFIQDENFLARFQREGRVVAKLEHPNIVPIYDYSEHEGQPYLVMKFIEGETLKAYLRRNTLEKKEIIRIARAISNALAYAHNLGILHRDIKPSNVLISPDGRIYLTDYGLARIAQAGESTMSADVMLGTPQYISPEQAMGTQELDPGTDIYSFGVMLYEMSVGEVPFSGDTPFSIVHDHIYTPLPLPRVKNPEVPESVERVLLKALAKKREDRFETATDLVDAFEKAMLGTGDPVPDVAPAPAVETVVGDRVPVQETVSAPKVDPVPASPPDPELEQETVVVADSASTPKSRVKKKKKRSRWWLLIPVVLILGFCGIVSLMILGAISDANETAVDGISEGVEDAVDELTDEVPSDDVLEPGEPPPDVPSPEDRPPPPDEELENAIRIVEENPDDPFAHLGLARVLWDYGLLEEAEGEFGISLDIATSTDKPDPDYFRQASMFLYERGLWVEAVDMYLMVTEITGNGVPRELVPNVEHAIFKAATEERVSDAGILERDLDFNLRNIDLRIIPVARARHNLYYGGIPLAMRTLEAILEEDGNYGPALYVQAEIFFFNEDIEGAIATLEHLMEIPAEPWLHEEAVFFLMEILENQ